GFWQKHTSSVPGSIKAVDSSRGLTTVVLGGQYSYGEFINTDADSNILQSQLPNSMHISTRSVSPNPSAHNFSEYLSSTNDVWNDRSDDEDLPGDFSEGKDLRNDKKSSTFKSDSYKKDTDSSSSGIQTIINSDGVKAEIKQIVEDPMNLIKFINSIKMSPEDLERQSDAEILDINARITKFNKFKDILQSPNVDLVALRNLSWSGIPDELRPVAWQLLLGYLPCNSDRRVATLARKRKEYEDSVSQAYAKGIAGLDQSIWHQIHIDVPRTNPGIALYQYETTQQCLERILYVWAIRHPASGYVQGINDLVTPFFQVFLSAYIDADPSTYDVSKLPEDVLNVIEADCFWSLSKLLDGIQDNYTFAQPGIQRQIMKLKELINRIDAPLAAHLQEEGIEFIQFTFRWMNCLLMREMSLKNTIRMWDTYMAEGPEGFSEFHLYVCAAFLHKWSDQLRSMDFQGIMMFLQSLPTSHWTEKDIEMLLSQAFVWKSVFHNAPNHLAKT
ncbi:1498_t:CDS:10, partial [Paraglomus occultum]